MKKIIILGGGFGGIETYRNLHRRLHKMFGDDIRVELISRTNFFTFSPMLHEAATGAVSREHVVQPLREILSCSGEDFHQATITKIDVEEKIVYTDQEGRHPYDVLVIALGAEQGFFNTPGAEEHALPLKWLPGAITIRNQIIHSFEQASDQHDKADTNAMNDLLHFVIVGGGATGTELAGQVSDLFINEMKDFYGDVPHSMTRISLIHAGSRLLEQLSEKGSASAKRRLEKLGVNVRLNTRVEEVTAEGVKLSTGEFVRSKNVFWTAGTESTLTNLLPEKLLNERGLVNIQPTFQLLQHPNVFALGDCAHVESETYAYPPTAQAAVQSASIVADNVINYISDKPLKTKKYRNKGLIIPLGNWYAIFERWPFRTRGVFSWMLRRAVFLSTMYGWANKLQVAFDWTIGLFLPRDTSEF